MMDIGQIDQRIADIDARVELLLNKRSELIAKRVKICIPLAGGDEQVNEEIHQWFVKQDTEDWNNYEWKRQFPIITGLLLKDPLIRHIYPTSDKMYRSMIKHSLLTGQLYFDETTAKELVEDVLGSIVGFIQQGYSELSPPAPMLKIIGQNLEKEGIVSSW